MEHCTYCGAEITEDDHGTWVDESGGDVCCYRGGKPIMKGNRIVGEDGAGDVHVPYDPEPPDMSGGSGGDDR
jgi:hypothetical protein